MCNCFYEQFRWRLGILLWNSVKGSSTSPTVVLHLSFVLQVSSFHHAFSFSYNAFLVYELLSWWFVGFCFLERALEFCDVCCSM